MSCGKLNTIGVIGCSPTGLHIAEAAARAGKEGLTVHVGRAQGKTCSRELEVSGVFVGREKTGDPNKLDLVLSTRKQLRKDKRKIQGKRKYGY